MRHIDINSKKHYFLDKNNHLNKNISNIKNGDYLVFPPVIDKFELDTALSIAKTKIAFDVSKCHDFNYNEWKFLINYAKQNNIKFLVNTSEEYDAFDLENYIEKFSRINKEGKKTLAFDYDYYSITDSSLLLNRKDDYVNNATPADNFIVISNIKPLSIDKYIASIPKDYNMIGFTLLEGETFNNLMVRKMKKAIDCLSNKCSDNKYDITFSSALRYYTSDEFDKLLKVEKYIQKKYNKDYELKFVQDDLVFNKRQIINANSKIEDIAKYIKKKKLSPYETILYLNTLLGTLLYNESPKNTSESRNVYSILNSKKIVCVGYSMLFNAIVKELNNKDLKSVTETAKISSRSYHSINCVYINDKKYKKEGYYKLDITPNNGTDRLINFMIPCDDFMHSYKHETNNASLETFIQNNGNLMNQTIKFITYPEDYSIKRIIDQIDIGESDKIDILTNTFDFLLTPMGKRALLENGFFTTFDGAIKIVNKCIKNTESIPIETTMKALEHVAETCYLMDDESKEYAESVITREIFNALFNYDRRKCQNDFAIKSLDIESGKISIIKNQTRRI